MAQTNESQEQVTINVETLQPVTRTLMTIGALPTSYLISMTYEEQLLWLQNYLIKTVIPAINNNAEATQEVQDIVMALQQYINDYFNNLDVQEEINKKLDDLVRDGTLTRLIGEYIQPLIDEQNQEISDFKTQVDNEIAQQNAQIQAVTSGSPLAASSVSEMTDTSRVYVNTTDGYWYYFNGTQWTQGDVYQSTRIGENEQVTFNQVVGAIDKYYTIANLNTWYKWSSDSSLLNGITNTDNGLNIQLPSTINKNVVISKNNIDFHSKKVILGFDITFNSKISSDDKFNIALNDATSLLTIHSNDYALNVNNHIEKEFNDTLSATGKLSLVCAFPIDCTIENIILKEYIDTSNLPYKNLPEALETLKNIENDNIETKDLILPNTIPCVRGLETNVFYDNILKNTNINSVERVDIESSIGGIFNRLKDRWRILLSSANSDIIQTFKLYLNDNNTPTKTYPVNIKVLDNTVGSGKTKKIMFIGDSLTDMNVYEQELLRMFNSDEMNIELVGTRGSSTTAMHEGRSGWTTKNYCTNASVGNTTNAFYNP